MHKYTKKAFSYNNITHTLSSLSIFGVILYNLFFFHYKGFPLNKRHNYLLSQLYITDKIHRCTYIFVSSFM